MWRRADDDDIVVSGEKKKMPSCPDLPLIASVAWLGGIAASPVWRMRVRRRNGRWWLAVRRRM